MSSRFPLPRVEQSPSLTNLCRKLVFHLKGFQNDPEYNEAFLVDDIVWRLSRQLREFRPIFSASSIQVELHRKCEKARIQSYAAIAEAIQLIYARMEPTILAVREFDTPIEESFSVALRLLIMLSGPFNTNTMEFAIRILHSSNSPMSDPAGVAEMYDIHEGNDWNTEYSDSTLSADDKLESEDSHGGILVPYSFEQAITDNSSTSEFVQAAIVNSTSIFQRWVRGRALLHRKELESFQLRQYWADTYQGLHGYSPPHNPASLRFRDIDDKAAHAKLLGVQGGPNILIQKEVCSKSLLRLSSVASSLKGTLDDQDAVREVLIGLQGRENLLIKNSFENELPKVYQIAYLTREAQSSVLQQFANLSCTVSSLRSFSHSIISTKITGNKFEGSIPKCKTLEAFAESVSIQVRKFDKWCASREREMISRDGEQPPPVISLLSLELKLRDLFSDVYYILFRITKSLISNSELKPMCILSTSSLASYLLDEIYTSVSQCASLDDSVTFYSLLDVFSRTAEPSWCMIGLWLGTVTLDVQDVDADGVYMDDESFIKNNGLPIYDPMYWTLGYTLRNSRENNEGMHCMKKFDTPLIFQSIALDILKAGKAKKVLNVLENDKEGTYHESGMRMPSLRDVLQLSKNEVQLFLETEGCREDRSRKVLSYPQLPIMIHNALLPLCQAADRALRDHIMDEACLVSQIRKLEDLYLMRRFDEMTSFCRAIFGRIENDGDWHDFHTLNSLLRDALRTSESDWVDISFIRLTYTGIPNGTRGSAMQELKGFFMTYDTSFPLKLILDQNASAKYNDIFIFLMQICRAKFALEQLLPKMPSVKILKTAYAMRMHLLWFVNSLLDFLISYSIPVSMKILYDSIRNAQSLDAIRSGHYNHLEALTKFCLCDSETNTVRIIIMVILELCVEFGSWLSDTAKATPAQIIPAGDGEIKFRLSRNLLDQFLSALSLCESELTEDRWSRKDTAGESVAPSSTKGESAHVEVALESSFGNRMISSEIYGGLDTFVGFIRKHAHNLNSKARSDSPVFEILAFSLRNWHHPESGFSACILNPRR